MNYTSPKVIKDDGLPSHLNPVDTSLAMCNRCGEGCTSDVWLNTKEAANYLRVSEAALFNMTSNGVVPYYKLSRRNRYRLSELKEMLLKVRGT